MSDPERRIEDMDDAEFSELAHPELAAPRPTARDRTKAAMTSARDLVDRVLHLEQELDTMRRVLTTVSHITIPILLVSLLLSFVILLHPDGFGEIFTLMLVFAFTPAGKFTAAGYVVRPDVPLWEPILILGTIDVIIGLFLVWNLPAIYRIPRLGPRLLALEQSGEKLLLRRDWVRRMAFTGLVMLVAIPFQGTGAVAGAVVGRLLGMGPGRTVGAIAVGGYGGVAVITLASRGILEAGRANMAVGIILAAAVLGAVIFLAIRWWRPRST